MALFISRRRPGRKGPILALVAAVVGLLAAGLFLWPQVNEPWKAAGTVNFESDTVLIIDPYYITPAFDLASGVVAQGEKAALGPRQVQVQTASGGKGAGQVTRARVRLRDGGSVQRRELGVVATQSGALLVIDPENLKRNWVFVGPRRNAYITSPDPRLVADVLAIRGYRVAERTRGAVYLADPISEQDEQSIRGSLVSAGLMGTITLMTGNSLDQLGETLGGTTAWASLPFQDGRPGLAVGFLAGDGPGVYPVYGLYDGSTLVGVEVQVSGPAF